MSPVPEAFDVAGRVVAVTGAASGIGRATARVLAEAGARLVVGDVAEAGLAETAAELERAGAECVSLPCDVSASEQVAALVAAARDRFGRLDGMANVAGILIERPILDADEAELDRLLGVNLKGVLFGCQHAARLMKEQGHGSIVNVASSAAFEPYPGLGYYSASKAGVVALTRVLAAEMGHTGVRVNAVAPGMVDTPMAGRAFRNPDGSMDEAGREAMLAAIRRRNLTGSEGRPEDVAWAVQFLVSDASRYMTGQVLHPNGGAPMA